MFMHRIKMNSSELLPADFPPSLEPSLADFLPQVHTYILEYKELSVMTLILFRKIFMACLAHCTVIQAGINMAYSTILENGLTKNFNVSKSEMSWIGKIS